MLYILPMVGLFRICPENAPLGWQHCAGELFDIFDSYKKIGSCTLSLIRDQHSPRKEQQFFPDSWFVDRFSERMEPVLEVTDLAIFQEKGMGDGRLCLQALYELSQKRGCGGRIQAFATLGSAPFYEHCGFEGGRSGEDGLKYFDPTPKNLMLLFPVGFSQNHFCFIPVAPRKVSQKEPRCVDNTFSNKSNRNFQRS